VDGGTFNLEAVLIERSAMNAHRKIVVGVDGSQNAILALKWALAEARLRGDTVEVLHGWHFPYLSDPTGIVPLPTAALQESAEMVVADALAECAAEAMGVSVTTRVEEATGAEFLIEASKDADLLVVGRRGHGGFLALVMGSLAQQVSAHAHCPVVVVGGPA
jgi:nucleotide-binding universal stress UspA family protein